MMLVIVVQLTGVEVETEVHFLQMCGLQLILWMLLFRAVWNLLS
jgi:hypothetical protein